MTGSAIEHARSVLRATVKNLLAIKVPAYIGAEALDLAVLADAGRSLLLHVHGFVRLVDGNLHLRRVAEESIAEFERDALPLKAERLRLLVALRALRDDVITRFPQISAETVATNDDGSIEPIKTTFSLAAFDRRLNERIERPENIDEDRDEDSSEDPYGRLRHVLDPPFARSLAFPTKDHVQPFLVRLEDLRKNAEAVRRGLRLLWHGHPGSRWKWISELASKSVPAPGTVDEMLSSHNGELPRYGPVIRYLYRRDELDEGNFQWLDSFHKELSDHVRVAASDFEARLGTRASAAWALQRYARRCRRLRLRALRSIIETRAAKGRKERLLSEDAALFLFDQGFEVVTEQTLGQHRYDIVGEPFLVEAKIYGTGKGSGREALVAGLKQVHQYATAFHNEGLEVEPVLLLFRIGGALASPPSEYTVGDLAVSIVQVDLGPPSSSGSKAHAPEQALTVAAIQRALEAKPAKHLGSNTRSRPNGRVRDEKPVVATLARSKRPRTVVPAPNRPR